jgi:hypothetical protein
MTRVYRLGARMMSRETRYGLDAGGVYTIEEVRNVRTVGGNVTTVTVQVGQRLVEVHDPDRVLVPAHIDAHGVRGRQRRAWRATFADAGELETWCKLNEATVRGQRFVEASEPEQA